MSAKTVLKSGREKEVDVFVPPATLTVKQIQDQIPAKYFERSTVRSLYYLARDITQLALTCVVMSKVLLPFAAAIGGHFSASLAPVPAALATFSVNAAVWGLYWFVQGLNATALWVLAHECGHQAFSPSRQLNNFLGFILHSAILVPYHSWRITHGNHHKHTNHLSKDTVFIPVKKPKVYEMVEEAPLVTLYDMLLTFTVGWPGYLLLNVASQDYGRRANHFEPSSPLFRPEERRDVVISDLGIFATLALICVAVYKYTFVTMFMWYGGPYFCVNFWLVFITFLQHTDLRIPHYNHEEWTFVRGAIAAVDRDYGAALNWWLHHINDSHVVHHIFSQMPFYHAITVTRKHIKEILGDLYVTDHRPLFKALTYSWLECRYVVPNEGVCVFYGPSKTK